MLGAARNPKSEAALEGVAGGAFGKYHLFASLGRGGMADVFLSVARGQMGFNKLAVIKRLRQALADESAFRDMFLDEARLAARLNHPNIVHTYEVGEQNGAYFIAMEYLEGQSLNKVLKELVKRNERLEVELSVRIIADALAGLGHSHELCDYDGRPLAIVHRDVSPHNLFVTYDGHTKLVDFGIAKAALSSTETEVGVLKGKVSYMSPEQAMGKNIDDRSDLFAMGIVLWELLTRQRLMTGESPANTLHKLMNLPIPRVASVVPDVDPALDAIVMRALEKDVDRRWQSARDMRAALEHWLSTCPRTSRHEDVGGRMVSLFGGVRDEWQRQIQRHMAAITTATNTQEAAALTAESLKRMEQSNAAVMSGQLLRLGGSGSGSGVIASYGGLSQAGSDYPSFGPPSGARAQRQRSSGALLIVVTIGCFALAGLLIVVLGLRDRKPVAAAPSATASAAAVAPDSATAGEGTTAPPPVVVAQTPASTAGNSGTGTGTGTGVRTSRTSSARAVATPKATAAVAAAAAQDEPGFLTVSAYPWAKVTEGSKVVCPVTPCNKVPMSPGGHTLTFENGEQPGQKQATSVTIRSGDTATKNIGFK